MYGMEIKSYDSMPSQAMDIRQRVFVDEQGFHDEFDETDKTAFHFVAYDDEKPVGTCRVFVSEASDHDYILGRLAVIKEYRGQGIGALLLDAAEKLVEEKGGKSILLHSQEQAVLFYEKQGYVVSSDVEYEQFCPHYWMKKWVHPSPMLFHSDL